MSSDSCHTVVRSNKGTTEENTVAVKAEKRQYADDTDSKTNPLYKTDAFRIERFKVSTSPLCCNRMAFQEILTPHRTSCVDAI